VALYDARGKQQADYVPEYKHVEVIMQKFRNLYVVVALIIVCLSGAVLFTLSRHSGPTDWTERQEVSVVLTKNGFEPKEVYITRGTKVTFSTTLDTPFWPASSIHPSHYIFPQFDPRAPISPDKEWSFIFDTEGRWGYHDHLDATLNGFIVVLPVGKTGKDGAGVLAACNQEEKSAKFACWSENMRFVLETGGLDATFDEIAKIYHSDPEYSVVCHVFTHDLGLLAYGKYGDDVPLTKKMGYCNDGFWHGYMEGFFAKHSNQEDAYAFCGEVKGYFKDTYQIAYKQCLHGIGHGGSEFLLRTRADLWGNIPKLADLFIPLCEPAGSNQFNCTYGAYGALQDWMQLQKRHNALLEPKAFLAFCDGAAKVWAQEGCAFEFTKRQRFDPDNLTDIFPLIVTYGSVIRGGTFIPSMVEGGAMSMGSRKQFEDDKTIVGQCDWLPMHLREPCLLGIIEGLFFSSPPGDIPVRTAKFCLSDALSGAQRTFCASTLLGLVAHSYQADKVDDVCDLFPLEIKNNEAICSHE
jgi:plastocyanin